MAAAARYSRLPQDCRVCRRPDAEARAARERWGCDGPSTEGTLFEYDCVRCAGQDPGCTRCAGTGIEKATRGAFSVIRPISIRVLDYVDLMEAGIFPVAGGWEEQSATFTRAVRFAANERAKIERRLAQAPPRRGGD